MESLERPRSVDEAIKSRPQGHVLSTAADFWCFGGLSILCWAILLCFSHVGRDILPIQQRLYQIPFAFSILSLACNHPHFISSYKIAYSRDTGFILRNWFPLVAVPVLMALTYWFAYINFDYVISDIPAVSKVNAWLNSVGITFQLGASEKLGPEILSLSIWFMYLTAGWHYSKQIFGIFLIKSRHANYQISHFQKMVLKFAVFSLAAYQFFYVTKKIVDAGNSFQDSRFMGITLSPIGFPEAVYFASTGSVVLGAIGVLVCIFYGNWRDRQQAPTLGMLTPLIAFYIWWIPMSSIPEFYLVMVPFFHSLQYLPFAFRIEADKAAKLKRRDLALSGSILMIVIVGFLSFELVPSMLDSYLATSTQRVAQLFTIMFLVFINVHHFFIDSVIWKFDHPDIKKLFL